MAFPWKCLFHEETDNCISLGFSLFCISFAWPRCLVTQSPMCIQESSISIKCCKVFCPVGVHSPGHPRLLAGSQVAWGAHARAHRQGMGHVFIEAFYSFWIFTTLLSATEWARKKEATLALPSLHFSRSSLLIMQVLSVRVPPWSKHTGWMATDPLAVAARGWGFQLGSSYDLEIQSRDNLTASCFLFWQVGFIFGSFLN